MIAFPAGAEVAHTETGEVMFVVAASPTAVLVDRASGRWSYPPDKLRPREIACPILRKLIPARSLHQPD